MSKNQEKEINDLRIILEITRIIGRELDLDPLLKRIISETTKVMEADRSSLFIYDKKTDELWIKVAEGIKAKEIRLPVSDSSIVGSVAKQKKIMNIPDAYECDIFNRDVDKKTGYRTRSILSSPLFNYKDEIVGVIQVLNKKDNGVFTAYDEELLTALSASAGLAIERTMLIKDHLEQEKLAQQMEIARSIQMSLLPETIPEHSAIGVAGYSEACDATGGDYYDVFELDETNLGIVVGDISGHGIGAALLMATARASLKALLKNDKDFSRVFANLNNMLEQDMDESRFMTMFLGLMNEKKQLSYVSAGHEPPLILHAASDTFSELDSTGMVLGMMEDMDFEFEGPLQMETDDIFVLYTDGVFEAMNVDSEEFGQDRVKALLREHRGQGPSELVTVITQAVKEYCGPAPQRDDITLVIGKVK